VRYVDILAVVAYQKTGAKMTPLAEVGAARENGDFRIHGCFLTTLSPTEPLESKQKDE